MSESVTTSRRVRAIWLIAPACVALLLFAIRAIAQDTPSYSIDEDVTVFSIAPDNTIAFAVDHLKRFDKIVIERDELFLSSGKNKEKRILDPDKFMPVPPPFSYIVNTITWSPDSQKLALAMLTKTYPWSPKVKGKKKGTLDDDDIDNTYEDNEPAVASSGGGNVLALFDTDGREIKVENSKTRFIPGALSGTWLSDEKTVVYLNGSGQIVRVTPEDGKSTTLFDQKSFSAVAWDAARNRAIAVGPGVMGRQSLMELGLLKETVAELARIDEFQGTTLVISPAGTAVGYYRDGDTIEVRSLSDPSKTMRVRTGPGRFEFDRDARRLLLKRGPLDKSNDLIWVRLADGNFSPILHDLVYHDFHIAPDGTSVAVEAAGRGILSIYPMER
ncbi:MAG TPA: hypothetical protein VNU84_04445 [Candidatus Acidoferrum sp.]|jgi:hypothetical protein|nr:hypothetical protein [Candidatus Acidoferrum sp.]